MTERLGLTVPVEGLGIADSVIPLARLAEKSGYTDIWSAEVGGTDGLTPLAAVATACPTLRLGTAILPAFSRPPALMAMGAASMQALSGGRFVLGIGTSSSIIIEGWMGVDFKNPYTRMRETVEVLRAAFSGEKVSFAGTTITTKGFRLTADPGTPVPIYIAGLGPKMLRLAGEVGDGVILFLFTPDGAKDAIAQVHEGARAAGRDPSKIDVVMRIGVAVDEDPQFLSYMLRRITTAYAMVDVYNASLSRQGFAEESSELAHRWKQGDRDGASAAITDRMLDGLYVYGDEDSCRLKLDAFREAGVTTPVILPISVAGDPAERMTKVEKIVTSMGQGQMGPSKS